MNESIQIGMEAINRWIFHGWNYETVRLALPNPINESGVSIYYVPQFLAEAKWTCNMRHMIEKWNHACHSKNPDAYLVTFYANLDNNNRRILLEWVLENYKDECKL